MKHTWKITLFLVLIFICSQLIGLAIINQYIDIRQTSETGKTVIVQENYDITGIAPPVVQNESSSWIYIVIAVAIGTGLVLLIIRFRQQGIWTIWFSLSVTITLFVALAPFMKIIIDVSGIMSDPALAAKIATISLALTLTYLKVIRKNIIAHNFTEVFIYGGIAALVVPIINLTSVIVILILISIYDMIAVWQSKHMIKMAKFQTESRTFAGLLVPYSKESGKLITPAPASEPADHENEHEKASSKDSEVPQYKKPSSKTISSRASSSKTLSSKAASTKTLSKASPSKEAPQREVRNAILGGGDIAFPLLFAGVILKTTASYLPALIIISTTSIALFCLLYFSKPDRFYPAMPFITGGCFAGYLLSYVGGIL